LFGTCADLSARTAPRGNSTPSMSWPSARSSCFRRCSRLAANMWFLRLSLTAAIVLNFQGLSCVTLRWFLRTHSRQWPQRRFYPGEPGRDSKTLPADPPPSPCVFLRCRSGVGVRVLSRRSIDEGTGSGPVSPRTSLANLLARGFLILGGPDWLFRRSGTHRADRA
jgi:hypothetical protein